MERLAKYISRRGVCSRREAERLIAAEVVEVNGKSVVDCVSFVGEDDVVAVRGLPLPKELPARRLWLYHKPIGLITSRRDKYYPTVFDNIDIEEHVVSVGRLDVYTSGLLLLTNCGALARKLELPSSRFEREYHVSVAGKIDCVSPGTCLVDEFGVRYTVERMTALGNRSVSTGGSRYSSERHSNFSIVVCEGKNREVRNIIKCLGGRVIELRRISYGPFTLGDLMVGAVREISIDSSLCE